MNVYMNVYAYINFICTYEYVLYLNVYVYMNVYI